MPSKATALKNATLLFVYLLIVWGLYRFLFQLPENFEDLLVKPLIWLVPVLFLLSKEKTGLSSVGLTTKNIFPSIYFALSLGVAFAIEGLVINYFKHGHLNFDANLGSQTFFYSLGLSLAVAIVEEIVFRGYIFTRLLHALKKELNANLITSLGYALINLPIAVFVWKSGPQGSIIYFLLTFLFGVGAAFVYARSRNILAAILLHVFWEWPIILFR